MRAHTLERDDTSVITFDDPIPDEITDQEAKSESLFDQLRSEPNSYINIMRQPMGGRNTMEFVARYEADLFDYGGMMAHIQKMYGGGEYRIMAYAQGRLKGNKLVTIAHTLKADVVNDNSPMTAVLNQLAEMQRQMLEIAREKQTGGGSRREMLEEMMLYKQIFAGEKSGNGIKDVLDTLGGLKDLGIDIGLGGEKESNWGDLAEKFLPIATMAMTPQQPRMMRPNPIPPNVRPQQPQQPAGNNMNMFVKMGVAQLVNAASKNADPANYAGMVVDNISEDVLKQFFNSPDLNFLKAINPNVGKFEPWFVELGEHVKAMIGLPSMYTDLYAGDESDTLDDDDTYNENVTSADISDDKHSERARGNTTNAQIDV